MIRELFLWASRSERLARLLSDSPVMRRAVRRFVPGEELDDALEAARKLHDRGIRSVLTLLGEHVESADQADAIRRKYEEALDAAHGRGLPTEISVKPTQLGLETEPEIALRNLDRLAQEADPLGVRVWLDMEESRYTDATLALFRRLRDRHSNVGICLQAYLYRTPDDLEDLLPLGPTVRLVKGAYDEPPDLAFPSREEVDESYLCLARRLLDEAASPVGPKPAFATHDTRLLRRVRSEAEARDLAPDAYEIQMLYGIRRDAQRRFAATDTPVRVLISYGPEWFPWYMRRLAERPANLWFVIRSLLGG